VIVTCTHCNHPPAEHDAYGCHHWFTAQEFDGGLCGCSWTRRQLLELDAARPPELWIDLLHDAVGGDW
jgi:hypothetical protein